MYSSVAMRLATLNLVFAGRGKIVLSLLLHYFHVAIIYLDWCFATSD